MKTRPIRRTSGFTLIELLVVISIIAVLAGGGFAAGNAAIQKAKRTTAMATCIALELAVNNFYTEYGTMPRENLTTDSDVNTRTDGLALLNVLLGTETGNTPLNPRKIKFLTVKQAKNRKDGLVYNSTGTTLESLVDPWGGPFFVRLDGDYDERVDPKPAASPIAVLNGKRAAVWSNGADAAPNGTGGKATDDVKTW
jgi:prepilin-type N-terminal cleavage/methylation domain-containing protein